MKKLRFPSLFILALVNTVSVLMYLDVFKKYLVWSCIYQDRNEQWIKRWFSSNYELCWKNIETEAVFTKREINNEWSFDFHQNTSCVCKGIESDAVFTKTEMNNEWNVGFLQNTSCVCKSIETEVVFTKREMNNEWNVHFLQKTSCFEKVSRLNVYLQAVFVKVLSLTLYLQRQK